MSIENIARLKNHLDLLSIIYFIPGTGFDRIGPEHPERRDRGSGRIFRLRQVDLHPADPEVLRPGSRIHQAGEVEHQGPQHWLAP